MAGRPPFVWLWVLFAACCCCCCLLLPATAACRAACRAACVLLLLLAAGCMLRAVQRIAGRTTAVCCLLHAARQGLVLAAACLVLTAACLVLTGAGLQADARRQEKQAEQVSDRPAGRILLRAGFPSSQKTTPHLVEDGVERCVGRLSPRAAQRQRLCANTRYLSHAWCVRSQSLKSLLHPSCRSLEQVRSEHVQDMQAAQAPARKAPLWVQMKQAQAQAQAQAQVSLHRAQGGV
jgi:hypothetical protein